MEIVEIIDDPATEIIEVHVAGPQGPQADVAPAIEAHAAREDVHGIPAVKETAEAAIPASEKGVTVATLSGGVLPTDQLPPLAITEPYVIDTEPAMLALDAQTGDVAIRTDISKTFILAAEPATELSNWTEILTPVPPVTSVAGKTGNIEITTGDVTGLEAALTDKADTDDPRLAIGTVLAHEWQHRTFMGIGDGVFGVLSSLPNMDVMWEYTEQSGYLAIGNPDFPDPGTPGQDHAWVTGTEVTVSTETTVRIVYVASNMSFALDPASEIERPTGIEVHFEIPDLPGLPTHPIGGWSSTAGGCYGWPTPSDNTNPLVWTAPVRVEELVTLPPGTWEIGVSVSAADWFIQSTLTEPYFYPPFVRVEVCDSIPPFPEAS